MCIMCEGATLDEARFAVHGIIDRYGWFIQYVQGETVESSWAYTVGLSAGFAHPELIIAGVEPEASAEILNELGEMVRAGERLTNHRCLDLPFDRHVHLSPVHRDHFERDVFAVWSDYYWCLGPPYPEEEALEVVLPGQKPRLVLATSDVREPPP